MGQRLLPLAANGRCRPNPDIQPFKPLARKRYVAGKTEASRARCRFLHQLVSELEAKPPGAVLAGAGARVDIPSPEEATSRF